MRQALALLLSLWLASPALAARDFNGSTDRLDNTASAPVTAYPFTICAWQQSDVDSTATTTVQIQDKDSANERAKIGMHSDGTAIAFVASADNTVGAFATAASLNDNAMHLVCGVFTSAASRTAYADCSAGAVDTEDVTSITGYDSITVGVSGDSTPAGFWDGDIAEVAVWNVALSATDIAPLCTANGGYSARYVRPQALVFWAALRGAQLIDTIGGRTLTATGTTEVTHVRVIP